MTARSNVTSNSTTITEKEEIYEACFMDFEQLLDGEAKDNLLMASIMALGNSVQRTNTKTI